MKNQTFKLTNTKAYYGYFLEKTSNLLYDLLIGEGDARSRLKKNELLVMYILVLDVPKDLKPVQKEIFASLTRKELSKVGEHILVSAYQNTVSSMRNSTASKIIARINSLYSLTKYANNEDN